MTLPLLLRKKDDLDLLILRDRIPTFPRRAIAFLWLSYLRRSHSYFSEKGDRFFVSDFSLRQIDTEVKFFLKRPYLKSLKPLFSS